MNPFQLITALESVIGLLVLWVFVFVFWKDYCLDVFRQNLFSLRDELFLYAAKGDISFQHPAYRMLRERMNILIRYGHEFTLTRFLLSLAILSSHSDSDSVAWESVTESLTEEQRYTLSQYRSAFAFYALKYVFLRSFFLAILVFCVKVMTGLREGLKRRFGTTTVVTAMERLESETIEEVRRQDRHDRDTVPVGA